ncbi:MAG TPA: hypothetical protein DCR51_02730 [Idiomarina loihiensis]|jgi:hypothetical protein|nr:hypothetical protein [Idiomarina loihiensis]|tara:strand:+ start:3590 stop:5068 length:1479 start_codon:yes stop_codon:yes gene_type:complete
MACGDQQSKGTKVCKNGILRVGRMEEFTTAKDYLDGLHSIDWWRYQYIHRYVNQKLISLKRLDREFIATFEWLEAVADKYGVLENKQTLTSTQLTSSLIDMANGLVYSYHIRHQVGAEINLVYENIAASFGYLFDRLAIEEVKGVKVMHDMSMELGFLVVPFYLDPDKETSWGAFVEECDDDRFRVSRSRLYAYPRNFIQDKPVQVVYSGDKCDVKDKWNMVVYYDGSLTTGELEKQISASWEQSSLVEIGNPTRCKFQMNINRGQCSRRDVSKYLKASIIRLKTIGCGGFFVFLDEGYERGQAIKREDVPSRSVEINEIIRAEGKLIHTKTQYKRIMQRRRKLDRENRQYIDALKLIDHNFNQYISSEKSNTRRAVGLRIWDRVTELRSEQVLAEYCIKDGSINFSKQEEAREKETTVGKVISSLIRELSEHNPEILNYYRKGWNDSDTSASGLTIMDTLKKRMRRDYQMTDYCITNRGYYSPYQATKGSK